LNISASHSELDTSFINHSGKGKRRSQSIETDYMIINSINRNQSSSVYNASQILDQNSKYFNKNSINFINLIYKTPKKKNHGDLSEFGLRDQFFTEKIESKEW